MTTQTAPVTEAMSVGEKLAVARLIVCEKFPYFSAAVLALIHRWTPGLGTMGVTKSGFLLIDPQVVEDWTVGELATVLIHECQHLLRDHDCRCKAMAADHTLWNISADLEENDDILEAIEKLSGNPPEGSPHRLQFPHFKHAPVEGVEAAPEVPKKAKGKKTKKKLAPHSPAMGGACFPSSFGEENGKTAEEYYMALRKKAKIVTVAPGAGWCGSGAGKDMPNEPEGGRSEAEIASARQEVADALNKVQAKDRGNIPTDWLRWAEQQLKPVTVPWQRKLARVCRAAINFKAGMVDYHYSRPSRRQMGPGMGPGIPILPVLHAPTPIVAVAVDTSGSMGESELLDAISETKGILAAAGSRVTFLACDASVHSVKQISDWKQIKALLKGGGGTDFNPIFDEVARMPKRPDVLIIATDGFGPAPAVQPQGMAVIWMLIGSGARSPVEWGEVVKVGPAGD